MLIKAVVWDMGGVLVSEDPPLSRHAWETKLGLDSGELARMVFYHPVTLDLFHGRARPDDLSRGIERELGVPVGSLAALTSDFWGTPCWREDVFAFINEKKDLRHAVLSDAWPQTREIVAERINEAAFDIIMFSYEEGVKKPALEIYERMVRRIGANSAEILFVDDKLVNVEGARRAGMRAVEFTNLPDLRRRIDGLL